MKRSGICSICFAVFVLMFMLNGSAAAFGTEMVSGVDFGDFGRKAYEYLRYIDEKLPDRDCVEGRNFKEAQKWIVSELKVRGYSGDQIRMQDFSFRPDGGKSRTSQNIIATLPGLSPTQIIIGAHYDGTGAGDNGSGVALLMETAGRLAKGGLPPKTLVFIFFSGEEYDLFGSAAYAKAMTKDEIARTEFMINLDSVISGDYCYLYGGVPDFDAETVEDTEAFEKVYTISQRLGLQMRLIPWTFDNPAPGFDTPDYPSPSTGDWSDHNGFANRGIQYVYFEASNWDIPGPDDQYDGDSETKESGKIMHSDSDHLKIIESIFPGRALYHLQVFSLLLHEVLTTE
jgi:hypothetical protein